MELLPLHIEYLLTRHECVIIPGVGALIASEKEACVDAASGVVTPRRREVSFNGSVVSDDGLLAHSIAQRERMGYEEAHRLLERLAARMAADLRQEGEASLGRVGRLVADAEGLVSFQPRRSVMASEVLVDAPLRVSQAPKAEAGAAEENREVAAPQGTTFRHTRTVEVPADRYVFTVRRSVAHVAAMIAAVVVIGLSFLIPAGNSGQQKASVMPVDEFLRRPLVIEVEKSPIVIADTLALQSADSVGVELPVAASGAE